MQTVVSARRLRNDNSEKPHPGSLALGAIARPVGFVGASIADAPLWMRRLLIAALLALCVTLGLSGYQNFGKVTNGVTVAGTPLGGLPYGEARAALDQRAQQVNQQRVTLKFRDTTWQPTLEELGVTLDTESAWSSVLRSGSGSHIVDRVLRAFHIRSGPIMLGMPLIIDTNMLQDYCEKRMDELGLAPSNAELKVAGDSVTVTQDSGGFLVSVDRLQQDLIRSLNGFTAPTINLLATYAPASIRAEEIKPQLTALGPVLSEPLRLYTDSEQWEISPHQIVEHLSLKEQNGRTRVVIDDAAIAGLVDSIANDIDQPVSNGSVDDAGPYRRLITPRDGFTVDRAELTRRIHDAITGGAREIEIPVTKTLGKGDIETLLNEYGVTNLIATGSSSFAGSDSGRATNVRRAAELIDGTLIAPGDVFSFNHALGAIVEVGGFVPAGATEGGIPGTSVGGGVCQVSTSVFRAALAAGMPIIEWYPHAYRSLYYEQDGSAPGLDASIQQPDGDPLNGADLKFKNISDGWMLIRVTASESGDLDVSLFGQATGFAVTILDPVYSDIVAADQTPIEEIDDNLPPGSVDLWQPARDGVTMIIHRTVYDADGTLILDEDFVSYYQPQGPVYRVSTDMAGSEIAA